jgi:ADP-ribose pyrophosphatase YjhB (NUDIX family)
MKFCLQCGQPASLAVPAGDNRPRLVCGSCGHIHYENPRLVVGCVPEYQGQILLCRRAIEPRRGYWTVPAGFMEIGESLAEAASRETLEEAEARVELGELFALVDVVHAGQVHVFFRGRLAAPEFGAGAETLETRLFDPLDIPWADIAFPSVRIALEQYLAGTAGVSGPVHLQSAPRRPL